MFWMVNMFTCTCIVCYELQGCCLFSIVHFELSPLGWRCIIHFASESVCLNKKNKWMFECKSSALHRFRNSRFSLHASFYLCIGTKHSNFRIWSQPLFFFWACRLHGEILWGNPCWERASVSHCISKNKTWPRRQTKNSTKITVFSFSLCFLEMKERNNGAFKGRVHWNATTSRVSQSTGCEHQTFDASNPKL